MLFATLDEAWGVPTFPSAEMSVPLARPSMAGRSYRDEVKKYIDSAFQTGGSRGVMDLLPPGFVSAGPRVKGAPGASRLRDSLVLAAGAAALLMLLNR